MAIIGPGAQQEIATDILPLLNGASEFEYVTILNPLSDDFAVRVATDVPVNMPIEIRNKTSLVQNAGDVTRNYGLDLNNPDFKGRKHFTSDTVIPAGKTINLKGNEAQVAVRQLVNEIIQREGNTRLMSDPTLRNEVEQRIVINRGSVQDLIDNVMQTPRQQINEAIKQSNEVNNEQPFPGLAEVTAGSADSGTEGGAQERRSPGRPKKA